jgi:hypothetical protein
MAVCAALVPHLKRHFPNGLAGRALVLGYGAIGEQVATFLREHFALRSDRVAVFDPRAENQAKAERRGFAPWQRDDFSAKFALVVGCSGDASFAVGDYVYLEKGALLASASSGAVELSRQAFIEMADASGDDDLWIDRAELDERNVHSNLEVHLVDRDATFVNAGFPVNFDGRLTVCPTHFIQPTPTMMVAAATQAVDALRSGRCGIVDLDATFSAWVDREFRALLGDKVEWLLPVPESAW